MTKFNFKKNPILKDKSEKKNKGPDLKTQQIWKEIEFWQKSQEQKQQIKKIKIKAEIIVIEMTTLKFWTGSANFKGGQRRGKKRICQRHIIT
jgi:hypothetical protein